MEELGITITLNTVDKILVEDRQARVRLESGAEIKADVVVANVDPKYLYGILESSQQTWAAQQKTRHHTLSMGLFVLFSTLIRNIRISLTHDLVGARYRELRMKYSPKSLPEDFSLYLHRPTATDTSFAPAGCVVFVLAPVPNLNAGIDWDTRPAAATANRVSR